MNKFYNDLTQNERQSTVIITRLQEINQLKTIKNTLELPKFKNFTIVVPTNQQKRQLQALIEVNSRFPKTWEKWSKAFNPMEKIEFLKDEIFATLLSGNSKKNAKILPNGELAPEANHQPAPAPEPDPTSDTTLDPPKQSKFNLSIAKIKTPFEEKIVHISDAELTRHVAIFGNSGSGKTILLRRIVEEVALNKVPCIVIDTHGDLTNLGKKWKNRPTAWNEQDEIKANQYFDNTEVIIWTPDNPNGNPFDLPRFVNILEYKKDKVELENAVSLNIDLIRQLIDRKLKEGEESALIQAMNFMLERNISFNISNLTDVLEEIHNNESLSITDSMRKGSYSLYQSIKNKTFHKPLIDQEHYNNISELINSQSNKTRISVVTFKTVPNESKIQNFVFSLLNSIYKYFSQKHNPFLNAMLFIDEAQNFAPTAKQPLTYGIILKIAREARKYGLGMVLATQNISGINTNIVNNLTTKFIGLQKTPVNIMNTEKMLEKHNTGVNKLPIGTFILDAPSIEKTYPKVQIPLCLSYAPSSPPESDEIISMAQESRKKISQP
jgi:DNA helicase HerA-like ATPase